MFGIEKGISKQIKIAGIFLQIDFRNARSDLIISIFLRPSILFSKSYCSNNFANYLFQKFASYESLKWAYLFIQAESEIMIYEKDDSLNFKNPLLKYISTACCYI